MAPAVFDTINVDIDVNKYNFKASGQNLKFKGFMVLYVEGNDSNENDDENVMLPMLEAGQEVKRKTKSKTKLYRTTCKIYRSKFSKRTRSKRNR